MSGTIQLSGITSLCDMPQIR